jgi:hypothetical protein
MNITLYKAAEEVRSLLEQIDPETGELPDELDKARALVATKAQACAAFILANEAEACFVEEHAKALLGRVKSARKRSEWLRGYLGEHMKACGITEIKSDDGTFAAKLELERDASVDVFDERQVPRAYMVNVPATLNPDKNAIRRAINADVDVPGARIVKKDRITIR